MHERVKASFLKILKVIPQGLILASGLFSIFITTIGKNIFTAKVHLYR